MQPGWMPGMRFGFRPDARSQVLATRSGKTPSNDPDEDSREARQSTQAHPGTDTGSRFQPPDAPALLSHIREVGEAAAPQRAAHTHRLPVTLARLM